MPRRASFSSLLLLLSLLALPAWGQSNYSGLSGTVFDPQQHLHLRHHGRAILTPGRDT